MYRAGARLPATLVTDDAEEVRFGYFGNLPGVVNEQAIINVDP